MAHSHHSLDASDFAPKMANPSAFAKTKHGGSALREFHEFALRGSVLDMAIGIILGVAFGKIISSFVEDLIMPLIGFVFGKVDFSNMFVSLTGRHFDSLVTAKAAGAPTLNYGLFLNATFNFVVVAFGVFLLVRQVNRLRAVRTDADLAETKTCRFCASTIALQAVRCPQCTSELGQIGATAAVP
jgi:large conductance mechanosensitive channel